jgi:hypothetical protein
MPDKRRHRVRVITDKGRYRRHQLKKVGRKVLKVALWIGAVAACIIGIYWALDLMFRQRPIQ